MAVFPQFKYFNRQLAMACSLIALSSFNYGFDNQGFATTQAMNPFDMQFGTYDPKTKTYVLDPVWLSLFGSLNYIGFAAGVIIGSFVSERYGRRWCMFSMSCYALITATLTVTSQNRDQIMAARILNYLYVGMELAVVPAYQSEIVPAPARGFIVGTYQLSLIFGGFIVNAVCRGTSSITDNRAWRIPLGLFYIIPTIILSLIWFVPESPRWLLLQGRNEEAKISLHKLRKGTFSDEEITQQLAEIEHTLEHEQEQGKFIELFQGVNLKRTILVVLANVFQQATGQAFASQYGAIYIKSLGTVNPFDMTLINAAVNIFTLLVALYLSDRIGRRPLILVGTLLQIGALFAMGALGTPSVITTQMKIGIVAMISIMAAGFSLGWAPLTYVITTELPALRLRGHTLRLGFFINVLFNFAVNFSIPYLISAQYANLGSKVGFIFGSISVLAFLFAYFYLPECTGKTLEQIDVMFHEGIKLRDFGKYDATLLVGGENHEPHDSIPSERKQAAAMHIESSKEDA